MALDKCLQGLVSNGRLTPKGREQARFFAGRTDYETLEVYGLYYGAAWKLKRQERKAKAKPKRGRPPKQARQARKGGRP